MPPPKLKPSEWVERHRILPAGASSEPGPMRLDRTPYVREILDAAADPLIEEITWVKCTQVAGSETGRNVIGYWIDADPGPTLMVTPDEKSAKEAIEERIRPMLESSPKLRAHVSPRAWDNKLNSIKLDTMSIYVGWAGSPQSLATRPCRRVFFDECDKYPPFSGREADPISLGTERTATYGHRRKILKTSTPTDRQGPIWKAWEGCGDRRFFHVPCPHCGRYQRLIWTQVKWPKLPEPDKVKLADQIEQARLAWYECENTECRGRIEDRHKPKMLARGKWASEGQTIDDDGTIRGDRPLTKRVGFHLSALYSPWRTFAAIAAEFIRADGDPGATMNFRNSWLAEPFENLITKNRPSLMREKAGKSTAPGVIGKDAVAVFATADTQKDHFIFTIRWWGYGHQSGLVAHGIAWSFEELANVTLGARFGEWRPSHLFIDSGGSNADSKRTDEVYAFAMRDPGRIIPTKGASHQQARPIVASQQPNGVVLRLVDTGYFKDILAALMNDPDDKWLPNSLVDDEYCQQMASEHKIIDRKSGKMKWEKATQGAANHFWDAEVLQCVAYYAANLNAMAVRQEQQAPMPVRAQPAVAFGGSKRW
jgi:phage terminase large subunit GpA-like protein